MRLIDADAFLKHEIERCDGERPYVGTCSTTNFSLKSELEKMSVIDAVPISVIESWLTEIALNTANKYLSDACEKIISRLDGLKAYYRDEFCRAGKRMED